MNKPETSRKITRRSALAQLGWFGALAGLAWPEELHAAAAPLPDPTWMDTDPEKYWAALRAEQFLLADNRIFLNPASLGIAPRQVLDTVIASLHRGAEYATDEIERWGYESLEPERAEMADFLG